jgi:hypothetical protein
MPSQALFPARGEPRRSFIPALSFLTVRSAVNARKTFERYRRPSRDKPAESQAVKRQAMGKEKETKTRAYNEGSCAIVAEQNPLSIPGRIFLKRQGESAPRPKAAPAAGPAPFSSRVRATRV